jgi:hypothetical protein
MPKRHDDLKIVQEAFKRRRKNYAQMLQALNNGAARIEAMQDVDPKKVAKLVVIGLRFIYRDLNKDSDLIEALEEEQTATRQYVDDLRRALLKDLEWLGNEVGGIKGASAKLEDMEKQLDKLNRRPTRRTPRTRKILDDLLDYTKRRGEIDAERLHKGLLYIG